MLKEIKEFKIKQLQSQMPLIEENEAQIKELKEKIEKLENQIEGKNQLIPSKKFNWLQKHITQRKQYKEQQKYAEGIMKLYQKKMHIDDKIQTLEQQQKKNISTKSKNE